MAEQLAMPLLIINMGGEMLYILEQRLQAQSIVEEKSLRVLQDVISTMFSDKFLGELFKPQKIYSNSSTRQIFDKLAHSSIMRLNQSSMDKLYDLMTMGCKYQFLTCSHPSELVQISLNHLDALKKLVTTSSEVSKLVESATNTLLSIYKDLRPGEFSLLRQTLCRFFQDRRVKVSLFLQDGIQSPDGSIIMSHRGVLPRGADIPGTIRYYSDDGKVSRTEVIKVPNAEGVQPPNNDYTDLTKVPRPCELGLNLYAKDRRKKAAGMATVPLKKALGGKGDAPENDETSRAAAKAELNLLASMLGGGKPTTEKDNINIVNLFPDTQLGGTDEKTGEKTAELIVFDAADAATLAHQLANSLDIGDSGASEDADLLDLMDRQ